MVEILVGGALVGFGVLLGAAVRTTSTGEKSDG